MALDPYPLNNTHLSGWSTGGTGMCLQDNLHAAESQAWGVRGWGGGMRAQPAAKNLFWNRPSPWPTQELLQSQSLLCGRQWRAGCGVFTTCVHSVCVGGRQTSLISISQFTGPGDSPGNWGIEAALRVVQGINEILWKHPPVSKQRIKITGLWIRLQDFKNQAGGDGRQPPAPLGSLHLQDHLGIQILSSLPLEPSGSGIIGNSKRNDTSTGRVQSSHNTICDCPCFSSELWFYKGFKNQI
jgi:hypothetical protein